MNLHSLKPATGSVKTKKRVGRGPGSGNGTTAGKGNKGHKSRSGYSSTFKEGGQMPLVRRLPKFGFTPPNQETVEIVSLDTLSSLLAKGKLDATMTLDSLAKAGVAKKNHKLKVLGDGEMLTAITITAHAFSQSAKEKIEKVGGKVIVAERTLSEALRLKTQPDLEKAITTPKRNVEKYKKALKMAKKAALKKATKKA